MNREGLVNLFTRMPTIATDRLVLRKMHTYDYNDMYSYASRADLTEYLLWSPHSSSSYTKEYLKYVEKRYLVGDFYDFAVVEKEGGKMIGTCGFTKIDLQNKVAEIGYVLNPDFHNRGYATEAARAVIEFGFSRLGVNRIEARFMEGNDASLRVMQKLGMTLEGYMRNSMLVKGKYRTIGVCSILKSEYKQ